MNGRKRGRASWFNVYEDTQGQRLSKTPFGTRNQAVRAADSARRFRKCVYRVRVRWYLEPKT